MGRFSSWAQGQAESQTVQQAEPVKPEEQLFIVENLQLRSQSQGIRYRCSPDMKDKHSKVALFGSKVKGVVALDGWVKVGSRYLPTHIGSARVLREDSPPLTGASAVAEEFEVQADKQLGEMLFGGYSKGLEEAPSSEATSREATRQLIRPETSAPGAEPLLAVGCGASYEVVYDRVAIRSAPLVTATTLEVKQKGDTVELFGWDSTKRWRQSPADALGTTAGWVMLDHPEFGPLVRPKGAPLCFRPLEPLCVAAAEDQLPELRRFLDEGQNPSVCDASGASALTLAARADARDCLVYLIEAGAVTSPEQSQLAMESATSPGTRALIEALLGHTVLDKGPLEDAFSELTADARLAADRIQEQLEDAMALEALKGKAQEEKEKLQAAPSQPRTASIEVQDEDEATAPPPAAQLAACAAPVKLQRKGGVVHEVVHKAVAIRYLPSTTADMVGTRIFGQFVELFEESADKKWRKMEDPETGDEGWMMLHHPQIGDLLRVVEEERLE